MKVLVIQSWGDHEFHEAVKLVYTRWPTASITALVDQKFAAEASARFSGEEMLTYGRDSAARPVISPDIRQHIHAKRFDLCVLSFNDRFGVRFWTFRLLPVLAGIPRVVAINGQQAVSTYGLAVWSLITVLTCTLMRLTELRVPKPIRDRASIYMDYLMIGLLTILAVGAAGLRKAGLHPGLRRKHLGHQSLFIFVPLFGLGGAQKVLINFLRRLDHEKCRVQVCTLNAVFKFFEPEVRRLNVSLSYLPCVYGFPYWKIIWALTRRLHQESPDAVIGWLPWATVFASIAGSLAGVPRIVTSLHSGSPARRQTAPLPWQRPLDIAMGYLADTVLACSHACREDYIAWARIPPEKIVTVHNGVDETELHPPTPDVRKAIRSGLGIETKLVVGIIARLSPEKDHPTFFKALTLVRQAVPSVHALVIGDGNDREQLIADVERMGLADCVTFLGARTDVLDLLGALDVLVLTSQTEGMPLVLLEAQALLVPVVTTDAGGAREAVLDGITGYVVPCGDSTQLAARVVRLLEDEPLRRRFGEAGRKHVLTQFGIDRMVAAILQHCGLGSVTEGMAGPERAESRLLDAHEPVRGLSGSVRCEQNSQGVMRIILLQSCRFSHFLSAAQAVATRYPGAMLIGCVRDTDLLRARATGLFAELLPLAMDGSVLAPPVGERQSVDLCVVPFESRLGVYHWTYRRMPMTFRVPLIASYNGRGRLRVWNRKTWMVNSLLICVGVRAVHRPALWAWLHLRRWLDVAGLFGLAVIANVLRGLTTLGLYPVRRAVAKRLPTGRQRLVLFIPSLGMGGAQRQLVTFLEYLDRSRWEPEVVILNLPDKFFDSAVRGLGVPVTALNSHYEFWMIGVTWRLMRHLYAKPCHVLHCWMHYAMMIGSIAGTLAGTPTVIGSVRSERPGRFPWWYPKWQRSIDMLTVPLQTTIIANSRRVREENRQWAFIPERKLRTIYNGVPIVQANPRDAAQQQRLRAELGLPAHAPLVGIVGRLCPEKDHGTFLRAAFRIAQIRPDARFLLIGDGEMRDELERSVERLGLSGHAILLGKRTDVMGLIQLMDVLVMSSTTEGFPNVLLEAAVANTPVVTTAAGGAVEVVQDGQTGFIVPVGDAGAMATRVLELLREPALAKAIAEAALDRVRRCFSADRMASEIQTCYLESAQVHVKRLTDANRTRVCFVSTHAYGFFRPSSGLPVGGAEIQICSLANELAQDRNLAVSVLTGDGGRAGKEQHGAITVLLSKVFGKLQVLTGDPPEAASLQAGRKAAPDAAWGRFERGVKARLDRLPAWTASGIRWIVRKSYICRELIVSVVGGPLRWLVHRQRELREFLEWVREIRSADADVYVMRCASPQVGYVQRACALLRRRFVYMVAHEDDVSGAYAEIHGIWGKRFEGGLRRADAIVCQHEDQLTLLRSRYGREGQLIRSLCPIPVRCKGERQRRGILWMARMDEWKQPELFLELASRMPEASFLMVGRPSDIDVAAMPRLQSRINGLANLKWVKWVPFEDTVRLFEEAAIFVNTSRVEGFPNTFLQAAACGTPIVSWAVNPGRILERFHMGYCADQDWDRFEHFIRELWADEQLRTTMGENGRRYVQEQHNPAVIARQYVELFASLGKDGLSAVQQVRLATRAE